MSKNAVIALACQIVKLREAARMWKQTAQAHKDQRDIQAANHETRMAELRSSMGVRIDADAQLITSLQAMVKEQSNSAKAAGDLLGWTENESPLQAVERVVKERDGLLTQVQDMRAERERLRSENQIMRNDAEDGYAEAIKVLGDPIALSKERDALRAEVAALQERLRASIARGDFAQMEVAALMSQTSKPCDQPVTVKREPEVGDMVRLVRVPTLQEYPEAWDVEWGRMGDVAEVVREPSSFVRVHTDYEWPLSCIEVVTEATHETEAGKAAAEAAVKTEPVADEIKVGNMPKEPTHDTEAGRATKARAEHIAEALRHYQQSQEGEKVL